MSWNKQSCARAGSPFYAATCRGGQPFSANALRGATFGEQNVTYPTLHFDASQRRSHMFFARDTRAPDLGLAVAEQAAAMCSVRSRTFSPGRRLVARTKDTVLCDQAATPRSQAKRSPSMTPPRAGNRTPRAAEVNAFGFPALSFPSPLHQSPGDLEIAMPRSLAKRTPSMSPPGAGNHTPNAAATSAGVLSALTSPLPLHQNSSDLEGHSTLRHHTPRSYVVRESLAAAAKKQNVMSTFDQDSSLYRSSPMTAGYDLDVSDIRALSIAGALTTPDRDSRLYRSSPMTAGHDLDVSDIRACSTAGALTRTPSTGGVFLDVDSSCMTPQKELVLPKNLTLQPRNLDGSAASDAGSDKTAEPDTISKASKEDPFLRYNQFMLLTHAKSVIASLRDHHWLTVEEASSLNAGFEYNAAGSSARADRFLCHYLVMMQSRDVREFAEQLKRLIAV